MTEHEAAVEATTEALYECVGKVVDIADRVAMPSRAILIFETIDEDGDQKVDFVVTRDLRSTDVIGLAEFVKQATMDSLLYDDEA